ncbi:Piso0_000821 [Millerozyma farinosa CBS 7064]|uniref:Piso0_000821 protein n=1 Tax=Pichia sorbitophila (strain ATCC MYA-4447 / BCRC 22081 / CBS 7064 / NBRC 10061 / NRRL Y-12695) TaxID=559304 RepID=G8YQ57_PICSO|nr:Piso0_000821 [Millerozyma farinosa CBS 7064]
MKPRSITFKNDAVFSSIDYDYSLAHSIYHENQIVIPDSTIPIGVNVYINGIKAGATNCETLVDSLGHALNDSELWQELNYSTGLFIEPGNSTFVLKLSCQAVTPAIGDFLTIRSSYPDDVNFLQQMTWNFHYSKNDRQVELHSLVSTMNFMLCSLLIDLEMKFPFIFSFYARKLFQLNYKMFSQNITELHSVFPYSDETGLLESEKSHLGRPKAYYLSKLLNTFQTKVRNCYTTLEIIHQCNTTSSRLQSCKRYRKKLEDRNAQPAAPVHSMSYNLCLLDLSIVERYIKNDARDLPIKSKCK